MLEYGKIHAYLCTILRLHSGVYQLSPTENYDKMQPYPGISTRIVSLKARHGTVFSDVPLVFPISLPDGSTCLRHTAEDLTDLIILSADGSKSSCIGTGNAAQSRFAPARE